MLTRWVHKETFSRTFLATKYEFRTLRFTALDVAPDLIILHLGHLA